MSDNEQIPPPPRTDDRDLNRSDVDLNSETQTLDQQLEQAATVKNPNAARNKKYIKYGSIAGALLFVIFIIWSLQPKSGGMAFGICSTFLEMQVPYPATLNYTALEGSRTSVRIYFTHVDAFGQFQQEFLECKFGAGEGGGTSLLQVSRNRQRMDQKLVDNFNKTIPAVIAGEPYTVMPPAWENQLTPR